MPSPFAGLSFITHLFICFLYKTVRLFRKVLFRQKKSARNKPPASTFAEKHDEGILPQVVIGLVFTIMLGFAFTSLKAGYRNTPNTFDLILSVIDTKNPREAPQTDPSPSPPRSAPPPEETYITQRY